MTLSDPNPGFKVMPLFDAEYLRNGTRYGHSYNRILIGTYTSPTQRCHFSWHLVILSDLAKYSMTWSTRSLSARAELLVQLPVSRGSVVFRKRASAATAVDAAADAACSIFTHSNTVLSTNSRNPTQIQHYSHDNAYSIVIHSNTFCSTEAQIQRYTLHFRLDIQFNIFGSRSQFQHRYMAVHLYRGQLSGCLAAAAATTTPTAATPAKMPSKASSCAR